MKLTHNGTEDLRTVVHKFEQLCEEVRKRIAREELEQSWRLEALDHFITRQQLDPATFQRLWVLPLVAAGASWESAITFIVDSHFQPN
jgi:hypothetical protein